jgi:hypothetical protein
MEVGGKFTMYVRIDAGHEIIRSYAQAQGELLRVPP